MKTQILTTDFTAHQLVNYKTHILEYAKDVCSEKIVFHQSEINSGHRSQYHLDMLELYMSEFRKWVPIVNAAKERDKKSDADFFSGCFQL